MGWGMRHLGGMSVDDAIMEILLGGAVTIRFTGETSKMSWAALPVEPACMGKVGEGTRRPPMFVGLAEQIKLQCSDIIKVKITI